MKRQIRRAVFESNSSSMHSLCIMKKSEYYSPEEILDSIYLYDDYETQEKDCIWEPRESNIEFGRSPFRAIGTFADKWLYACASMVEEYNDNTYKELERIAFKYIPGLKKIVMPFTYGCKLNRNNPKNIPAPIKRTDIIAAAITPTFKMNFLFSVSMFYLVRLFYIQFKAINITYFI